MWPDRVSNPGPLTYESGALPTALRGPAFGLRGLRWFGGLRLCFSIPCQRSKRLEDCVCKFARRATVASGELVFWHFHLLLLLFSLLYLL